jgi:allantoinase
MTTPITTPLRAGLDHDWFPFRTPASAPVLALDDGATLAVTLTVVLQHFRIDYKPPFPLPGELDRPYPDMGNFSQRQAGLAAGLWRVVDAIEAAGIPASFVVEHDAIGAAREIADVLRKPGHCVVASGEHAARVHTPAMTREEEAGIIRASVAAIRKELGRDVIGWRSPYCAQSANTLELLAQEGLSYVGDFANDDRPFQVTTPGGGLLAVPMNHFYSDLHFLHFCRQSVDEFSRASATAADVLASEGRAGNPAVLSLVVHPWLIGAPHRIEAFSRMLRAIQEKPGVRFMSTDRLFELCSGLAEGAKQHD